MSTVSDAVRQLNAATTIIVLVISFVCFIPGILGLILSVAVFWQPVMRRKSCVLYLLASSIADLFVEFVVLPVRIASNGFGVDLAFYNRGICKVETFSFYTVRSIASWLIAFACVDRFLHSSRNPQLRRFSSLKTARLVIGITVIAMTIIYINMPVYYEISYSRNAFGVIAPTCNGQKGVYLTFISFWNMLFYTILPGLVMLVFGSLTIANIRQSHRVMPLSTGAQQFSRRTNNQLLRMLAAQVCFIIGATLPHSIYRLYAAFTARESRSALGIAQENLGCNTVNTLTYFAHTSHFYLYTLTGSIFRKEVVRVLDRWFHIKRYLAGICHVETN
ncbi:unnamed protein product [Rotaria socialis]|uniref:G-protein coupled receptors family 1 profile domain-containing protein n=1 Tax=Rotaria socialis TaxID=392032 RepID=A0A818FUA5_9BILA|nr:unnamed protein product [Rotaria socialis]CAF4827501.1 unnamed protein product [Rotaria socialis]